MDTVSWLLLLVGLVGAASLVLGLTNRRPFRLAMRNVRRGRWRTALLLMGLLVGTTIVSGSLVIGDTVSALNVHYVYQAYGYTDEAIYNQTASGGYAPFPASVYSNLSAGLAGDSLVSGLTPEVVGTVQALDLTTKIPQTNLNLIGANANQSGALGSFTSDSGASVSGPRAGGVLLDDLAASDVNASVGDPVTLYGAGRTSVTTVVQAIVRDDTRGGFLFGGNVFVDLATAQQLSNYSGAINFLAVTNSGSLATGATESDQVSQTLNATLTKTRAPPSLTVHELLKDNLAIARNDGSSLSTFFLVLGLFSIIAGGMLIVGIFVMLAEERKGEMGMLRAIGLRRRQLVLLYYFEGLAYSAGSALAGTLLGVGVAYLITVAFSTIFTAAGSTSSAVLQSFTVLPSSVVLGYVVGFLLTLATVAGASARASRLNIVRAIRSIPEPAPTIRVYTLLAYGGAVLLAVGGYVFFATYKGTTDLSLPITGGGVMIGGAALLASRFVPNRAAFTAAGVAWLVWGGTEPLHRYLLGSMHTGTIFVFFLEGIFMILGTVTVYIFNSGTVVRAVSSLVGRHPGRAAMVRIGMSYPGRRPFRTAVNLMIFSLVIFTVVGVASFGSSLQANLDSLVRSESGGYTYFATSLTPIPDLPGEIRNDSTLAGEFTAVVPILGGSAFVNFSTLPASDRPYAQPVYAPPAVNGSFSSFYASNQFNFSGATAGVTSTAIWSELEAVPGVAVVDHGYAPGQFNFGGPVHPTVTLGQSIQVTNAATGRSANVTVIGILNEDFLGGVWLNPSTARSLGYVAPTYYLLTIAPGVSETLAAQHAKTAFFAYGLIVVDFAQVLRSSIDSTEAFVGLLEIFVALGLAVGIAAMGIVALRSVAERRAEIGMLRATGFTQGAILKTFLFEYSYVGLLGIGFGTALGILLIYDVALGSSGFLTFSVPWGNIGAIVLASYALTVLAVLGPSLKAARLPPAAATRYSE